MDLSFLGNPNFLSWLETLVGYYFGSNAGITLVAMAIVWVYRVLDKNPDGMRFWGIFTTVGMLAALPILVMVLAIFLKEAWLLGIWPWLQDTAWPALRKVLRFEDLPGPGEWPPHP